MNKSTAVQFFESLPASARKKLNLDDFKAITGAVLVKDRIQQFFVKVARDESALRNWKRAQGYCGGEATCLTRVTDGKLCAECSAKERRWRNGEARKNGVSEYGRLRRKEKAAERAAKGG